jgi:hypothetical protein
MKTVSKIFRYTTIIISSLIVLLFLSLYLTFQAPAVQQFFIKKAREKVETQSNITFSLGSFRFYPPGNLVLNELEVVTKQQDTILVTEKVSIHIALRKLFKKQIQLNRVNINSTVVRLEKLDRQGTLNFQFSTSNKKKKNSPKSSWIIQVRKVDIQKFDFQYTDRVLENKLRGNVGALTIEMEQMDLKHNQFAIKQGIIANSSLYLHTNKSNASTPDTSAKTPPVIELLKNLKLENISVDILNKPESQKINIDNLHLNLSGTVADLANKNILVERLALRQTQVNISDRDSLANNKEITSPKENSPFSWHIGVNEFLMEENKLSYSSPSLAKLAGYLNSKNTMQIEHISAMLTKWRLSAERIEGEVAHLSLAEQNGFRLKNLQTKIMLNSDTSLIKHLQFQTDHSALFLKASSQSLLNSTSPKFANRLFHLEIAPSYLSVDDLAGFYDLTDTFHDTVTHKEVHFSGNLEGSANKLTMNSFRVYVPRVSQLHLQGEVNNLLSNKSPNGSILLDTLWVDGHRAKALFNDTLLPEQFQLPDYIMLQGEAIGDLAETKIKTKLKSSFGQFNLSGTFRQDTLADKQTYRLNWEILNGNMAKLLSSGSPVGLLSLKGELTAKSKAFKNFNGQARINADTLVFNNYRYSGIELSANLQEEFLSGAITISDPNLALALSGKMARTHQMPQSQFRLEISKAQLAALGFSKEDLQVSTKLISSFQGRNFEQLTGNATLSSTTLITKERRYVVDSIALKLLRKEDYQLTLSSPFIHVHFQGQKHPIRFTEQFIEYAGRSLFTSTVDTSSSFPNERFSLNLEIKSHPVISTLLLPGLSTFGGFTLEAQQQQNTPAIAASGKLWGIKGAETELDTAGFRLSIDTTQKALALYIRNFNSGQLSVPYLQGSLRQNGDNGEAKFLIKDKKAKEKYHVRADLAYTNRHWEAQIIPDTLLLNYQNWQLPESNKLYADTNKIVWEDMIFSYKEQKIAFQQQKDTLDMRISFEQFRLSTLSAMVSANDIVQGNLNGNINISSSTPGHLSSNLSITDLRLFNQQIFQSGKFIVSNTPEKSANLKGELSQEKGKLLLKGKFAHKTNEAELSVEMHNFDLSPVQPFLADQMEQFSGTLDGRARLRKNKTQTRLNGELRLQDILLQPVATGTKFEIPNSTLNITDSQLVMNNFTIVDANNNQLTINGKVKHLLDQEPILALKMQTQNFQWLSKTETESLPYYGKLNANLTAQINGTVRQPTIEAEARLNGPSDLTYLLPGTQQVTIEQQDIVTFKIENTHAAGTSKNDSIKKANSKASFDPALTARLEIDKQARLTLMIDPTSNERLELQGTAALNFQKNRSGQLSLTGQYRISEGVYSTNLYQLIRRDFAIESGSSLTWTGDPATPRADMTATYQVRTSPSALVSNEITQMSKDKQQQLARSIPFLVRLHIEESLLAPEIRFDIKLPPENQAREVEAKLAQINRNESEVNKQALSLLLLGTFTETSMSSNHPVAYEIDSKARTGLSSLLSNQLNKLAAEYVKGVDVNVAVTSYSDRVAEKTEANTQVQLDLEKRFFNDRLSVQVGGKMNLEDPTPENTSFNSLAGNVVMLYDLTPDGRLKLKGFSTTEYENYLEGEITKTGVGIIFNRDYQNLRQMFSFPADTTKNNSTH